MRNFIIVILTLFSSVLLATTNSAEASVKKACDDFKSKDAEIRRSAILVLSKYQNSTIVPKQLILALKDDDELVRQTAFVAITEMIGTLSLISMSHPQFKSFKNEQFLLNCLTLLEDKNVDTRRLVSAGLRTIFFVLSNDIPLKFFSKSSVNRDSLVKAFSDSDSGVRYNMVSNYSYISQYVSQQILVKVVDNPKELSETQLLALSTFLRYGLGQYERYFSALMKLPSLKQRRLVMKYCSQIRNKTTLKAFVNDNDLIISSYAVYALMQKGEDFTFKFIDQLTTCLLPVDTEQGKKIVRYIRNHKKLFAESKKYITTKVKDKSSPYYKDYLKLYLVHYGSTIPVTELMEFLLTSESNDVYTITSYLRKRKNLKLEDFSKILVSDNYDAKSGIMNLLYSMSDRQLREEVVLELLLDEDFKVSSRALSMVCSFRIDGWEDIVTSMISDCDDEAFGGYINYLINSSYGKNYLAERVKKEPKFKLQLQKLMKTEKPTSYYYRSYKKILETK